MKKKFLFLLFFLITVTSSIAQCPMCKSGVESSMQDGSSSVGMGLNAGILFMLAIVYSSVLIIGILWYLKYRQHSKSQHAQ